MNSKYLVAIFGGAVSGAEAAHQLAQRGIASVVFDQNILPYGKIEDGLPKWHAKLRDKEEGAINDKLSHELVDFVPGARLGRDIDFDDIASNWGFSAVLLAIGAWKDRPLSIDGIQEYIGKGLIYQNPFIYWFNHKHEPDFKGKDDFTIKEGAIVVGGGLASLDVLKVLMLETVQRALRERGHQIGLFDLDRSIPKVLDSLGVKFEDLGIEPCTLYYRRRVIDMPLSPLPVDTPEQLAKAQSVREKILNNYQSKYLFQMQPNRVPVDKIVEGDQLVGLIMAHTEIVDGRVRVIPGTEEEVRGSYVISSIGSIPEPIPGIPQKGSTYEIAEEHCCRIMGYPNVFALGNAVTGRGNIKESMKHGAQVTQRILSIIDDPDVVATEETVHNAQSKVAEMVESVQLSIAPVETSAETEIRNKVRALQSNVGYNGDFMDWVAQNLPPRLEDLEGGH